MDKPGKVKVEPPKSDDPISKSNSSIDNKSIYSSSENENLSKLSEDSKSIGDLVQELKNDLNLLFEDNAKYEFLTSLKINPDDLKKNLAGEEDRSKNYKEEVNEEDVQVIFKDDIKIVSGKDIKISLNSDEVPEVGIGLILEAAKEGYSKNEIEELMGKVLSSEVDNGKETDSKKLNQAEIVAALQKIAGRLVDQKRKELEEEERKEQEKLDKQKAKEEKEREEKELEGNFNAQEAVKNLKQGFLRRYLEERAIFHLFSFGELLRIRAVVEKADEDKYDIKSSEEYEEAKADYDNNGEYGTEWKEYCEKIVDEKIKQFIEQEGNDDIFREEIRNIIEGENYGEKTLTQNKLNNLSGKLDEWGNVKASIDKISQEGIDKIVRLISSEDLRQAQIEILVTQIFKYKLIDKEGFGINVKPEETFFETQAKNQKVIFELIQKTRDRYEGLTQDVKDKLKTLIGNDDFYPFSEKDIDNKIIEAIAKNTGADTVEKVIEVLVKDVEDKLLELLKQETPDFLIDNNEKKKLLIEDRITAEALKANEELKKALVKITPDGKKNPNKDFIKEALNLNKLKEGDETDSFKKRLENLAKGIVTDKKEKNVENFAEVMADGINAICTTRKKNIKDKLQSDHGVDLSSDHTDKYLKKLFEGEKGDEGAIDWGIKNNKYNPRDIIDNAVEKDKEGKLLKNLIDEIKEIFKDGSAKNPVLLTDGKIKPKKLNDEDKEDGLQEALKKNIKDKNIDPIVGLLLELKNKDGAKKLLKELISNTDKNSNKNLIIQELDKLKKQYSEKQKKQKEELENSAIAQVKKTGNDTGLIPNLVAIKKFKNDKEEEFGVIDELVKKLPQKLLKIIVDSGDKFVAIDQDLKSHLELQKLKDDLLELEKDINKINSLNEVDDALSNNEIEISKEFGNKDDKKQLEEEFLKKIKAKISEPKKDDEDIELVISDTQVEDEEDPEAEKKNTKDPKEDTKDPKDTKDTKEDPKNLNKNLGTPGATKDDKSTQIDGLDYYSLDQFTRKLGLNRETPDSDKAEIYFCYVQEPGNSLATNNYNIPNGWSRNPHLVTSFFEDGKKRVIDAALSGEDFGVRYSGGKPDEERIKAAANSLKQGYFFEKAICALFSNDGKNSEQFNSIIRNLESFGKKNLSTELKNFIQKGPPPIPVKLNNSKFASANVLEKSDDGLQAKVAFILPSDNKWPDDFLNIRYIHIPGNGESTRSLKVKVELIRKDGTEIDGVKYNRGDVVIHKKPYEMRGSQFIELKKEGKGDDKYTAKEIELMRKMKISATVLQGNQKGEVSLKKMVVMEAKDKKNDLVLFKTEIKNVIGFNQEEAELIYKNDHHNIPEQKRKLPPIWNNPELSFKTPGKNGNDKKEEIKDETPNNFFEIDKNKAKKLKERIIKNSERFGEFENFKFLDKNSDKVIEFDLQYCTEGLIEFALAQIKAKNFEVSQLKLTNVDKVSSDVIRSLTTSWKGIKIKELEIELIEDYTLPEFKNRKTILRDAYEQNPLKLIKDALGEANCSIKKAKFDRNETNTSTDNYDEYEKQFRRAIEITKPINIAKEKFSASKKEQAQSLDLSNIDSKEVGLDNKLKKLVKDIDQLGKLKEIKIKKEHFDTSKVDTDFKKEITEKDGVLTIKIPNSFVQCAKAQLLQGIGKSEGMTQ